MSVPHDDECLSHTARAPRIAVATSASDLSTLILAVHDAATTFNARRCAKQGNVVSITPPRLRDLRPRHTDSWPPYVQQRSIAGVAITRDRSTAHITFELSAFSATARFCIPEDEKHARSVREDEVAWTSLLAAETVAVLAGVGIEADVERE